MAERKRRPPAPDGLDGDFGPGFDPSPEPDAGPAHARNEAGEGRREVPFGGLGAGIPCGKDGCFLKPVGDLVTRFALELGRRGHADSTTRAAVSGIELLNALRDFLDEEIAFAERAAERQRSAARYTKIPVE